MIGDVEEACRMGEAGHRHVKGKFGLKAFGASFKALLEATREERRKGDRASVKGLVKMVAIALLALAFSWFRRSDVGFSVPVVFNS